VADVSENHVHHGHTLILRSGRADRDTNKGQRGGQGRGDRFRRDAGRAGGLLHWNFMENFKSDFIEFMLGAGALRFGNFTTKSGRKTPYFINTGAYVLGSQM